VVFNKCRFQDRYINAIIIIYYYYFIAVFVKIVIAECALSKAHWVLTQVSSNLMMTTIFKQKMV